MIYDRPLSPGDVAILDTPEVREAMTRLREDDSPRNKHLVRSALIAAGASRARLDWLTRIGLRGRRWSGAENMQK